MNKIKLVYFQLICIWHKIKKINAIFIYKILKNKTKIKMIIYLKLNSYLQKVKFMRNVINLQKLLNNFNIAFNYVKIKILKIKMIIYFLL